MTTLSQTVAENFMRICNPDPTPVIAEFHNYLHVCPELNPRCSSKLLSGKQCSHKHLPGENLCGMHQKRKDKDKDTSKKNIHEEKIKYIEIISKEINGIVYFIDVSGNVYDAEHVMRQITNPTIIGKLIEINETWYVDTD